MTDTYLSLTSCWIFLLLHAYWDCLRQSVWPVRCRRWPLWWKSCWRKSNRRSEVNHWIQGDRNAYSKLIQVWYMKWSVKVTQLCVSDSLQLHGLYSPWNYPSQNTGAGSVSILQGIFPTQGSNPGLPHCGWILLLAEPQYRPYFQQRNVRALNHSFFSLNFLFIFCWGIADHSF